MTQLRLLRSAHEFLLRHERRQAQVLAECERQVREGELKLSELQRELSTAQADRIVAVLASLRGAFPGLEKGARIALLMRFGWAQAPTARVRRLPLEDSVAVIARLPQKM